MAKSKNTLFIETSPIGVKDAVTIEHIITYCREVNEVEWLKAKVEETRTTKRGTDRKITFMEVRKDFYAKFFPAKIPEPKTKKPTFRDKVAML